MHYFCPEHKELLDLFGASALQCPHGCVYPIVSGIPRFVPADNYASAFGLQWNKYRTTQLDSQTGLSISSERLTRLLGGSMEIVRSKAVLEAGCGAGRFSELLLSAGACLSAVDISSAVEANLATCSGFPNYRVCQASILELPFLPEQFDVVICVGVIQHTPDPEQTIGKLCDQVKPGGMLVIDHYTHGYPESFSRRVLRTMLLKMPRKFGIPFCRALTALLWPLHALLWRLRGTPGVGRVRDVFLRASPLVDYHDAYPQLGPALLRTWATLDTHDTLTDRYKHLRSAEQIAVQLEKCGMTRIETCYAGNGVEARAIKMPASYSGAHEMTQGA